MDTFISTEWATQHRNESALLCTPTFFRQSINSLFLCYDRSRTERGGRESPHQEAPSTCRSFEQKLSRITTIPKLKFVNNVQTTHQVEYGLKFAARQPSSVTVLKVFYRFCATFGLEYGGQECRKWPRYISDRKIVKHLTLLGAGSLSFHILF
jgi:hypothetical protein